MCNVYTHFYDGISRSKVNPTKYIRNNCMIWQMIYLPTTDVTLAAAAVAGVVVVVVVAGVDVLVGY